MSASLVLQMWHRSVSTMLACRSMTDQLVNDVDDDYQRLEYLCCKEAGSNLSGLGSNREMNITWQRAKHFFNVTGRRNLPGSLHAPRYLCTKRPGHQKRYLFTSTTTAKHLENLTNAAKAIDIVQQRGHSLEYPASCQLFHLQRDLRQRSISPAPVVSFTSYTRASLSRR